MRTVLHAKELAATLAIALLLAGASGIGPQAVADASGQPSGGPTSIMTCDPQSGGHSADGATGGAPPTGPETSSGASNGSSEQAALPLWCASSRSDGKSPQLATNPCGTTTGAVTIESSTRGFDWVC